MLLPSNCMYVVYQWRLTRVHLRRHCRVNFCSHIGLTFGLPCFYSHIGSSARRLSHVAIHCHAPIIFSKVFLFNKCSCACWLGCNFEMLKDVIRSSSSCIVMKTGCFLKEYIYSILSCCLARNDSLDARCPKWAIEGCAKPSGFPRHQCEYHDMGALPFCTSQKLMGLS